MATDPGPIRSDGDATRSLDRGDRGSRTTLSTPTGLADADTRATAVDRRGVARAVLQWVTGDRVDARRVVRLADRRWRGAVEPLLGPEDVLLLPSESVTDDDETREAPTCDCAAVLDYRGGLDEPGDVAWFGELRVQTEDYASIAFLPVTGATTARLRDANGWQAYLEDADAARASGRLVPQLLGAAVAVSGLPLTDDPAAGPVAAVDVGRDGVATLGPDGLVLGDARDPDGLAAALDRSYRPLDRLAALGGGVADDIARRPWLALYRAGLAFAAADDTGPAWSVVGLGTSLRPDGEVTTLTRSDLILLHRGDERVLVEPRTLRRFALAPATAVVVERLLSDGPDDEPRTPADEAFVSRLVERFEHEGVHLRRGA
jgi:hypothetical protein